MKLKAPKGCGNVSFQGQEYPVVKGVVEVPDEAQVFLEPGYGFTQIVSPAAPTPETEAPETEAPDKAKAKKS
ncbi:MAG: hypothetical protein FJ121_08960 [Deltaproteobacteria bacterium]|nr:hypothetical protein [Deltaproteobacteria bacterium]